MIPMHRWIGAAMRELRASIEADGSTATLAEIRTARDWRGAWLEEHVIPHGDTRKPVALPWAIYSGVVACIPNGSHRAGWMRFHGFTSSPGT